MKRVQEQELDPTLLDRLKRLLSGEIEPEGVYQILAFLEPAQLHFISKLPDMQVLRTFLSRPDTFQKLYERRKASVPRSKISCKEEDLVDALPTPINYWHVWLAASTHKSVLYGKSMAISVYVNHDANFFKPRKDAGVFRVDVRVDEQYIDNQWKDKYTGQWARYCPEARDATIACNRALRVIFLDEEPQLFPVPFSHNQTYAVATGISTFGVNRLIDVLDFDRTLKPYKMLEFEGKMDALRSLQDLVDPFESQLQHSLFTIIDIYRKQFAAVFTYMLLNQGYFLDAQYVGFDQSVTLIRNEPHSFVCSSAFLFFFSRLLNRSRAFLQPRQQGRKCPSCLICTRSNSLGFL